MFQSARRLYVVIAAMAVVLFPPTAAPLVRAQSGAGDRPFVLSSMGTAFGVQGEFVGDYRIEDDVIAVHVTTSTLYVNEDCPYKGRRAIIEITFGLAGESGNGKWNIKAMAPPISVGIVMRPGETRDLNEMDFRIPLKRNVDPATRWFVVAIKEEILDPPRNSPSPLRGTNFAHSCKNIFAPNFDSFRRRPNVPASGSPRNCP